VIRGVNVFPSEIEAVLLSSPALAPHYTIVVDSTGPMPEMVVVCELAGPSGTGEPGSPAGGEAGTGEGSRGGPTGRSGQGEARGHLAYDLSAQLSDRLGVSGRVVVGPPGCLPRTEVGKAVRLVRRTPGTDERPPALARLMEDS
jgi:phenylacetate-CoA ligase